MTAVGGFLGLGAAPLEPAPTHSPLAMTTSEQQMNAAQLIVASLGTLGLIGQAYLYLAFSKPGIPFGVGEWRRRRAERR